MASAPLCLAICSRCRNSERIASGALDPAAALAAARAVLADRPQPVFCRLSQCLHCCDGGHTVRVECGQTEVALVGIRTAAELARVAEHIDDLGRGDVAPELAKRLWQRWDAGRMVWHRNVTATEGSSSTAGSPAHDRAGSAGESST